MNVPVPVTEGSKYPPETPGPLYVPPKGFPPERRTGGAVMQIEARGVKVTTGKGFTTIFCVAEPVHEVAGSV